MSSAKSLFRLRKPKPAEIRQAAREMEADGNASITTEIMLRSGRIPSQDEVQYAIWVDFSAAVEYADRSRKHGAAEVIDSIPEHRREHVANRRFS
jgi:hypothetical protein